ncbi:hypothetical protein WDU94_015524 [Cyamophila willieti]
MDKFLIRKKVSSSPTPVPSTSRASEPSTSRASEPSTSRASVPSTSRVSEPSTSRASEPSTSQSFRTQYKSSSEPVQVEFRPSTSRAYRVELQNPVQVNVESPLNRQKEGSTCLAPKKKTNKKDDKKYFKKFSSSWLTHDKFKTWLQKSNDKAGKNLKK